jgi:hypothetical protein
MLANFRNLLLTSENVYLKDIAEVLNIEIPELNEKLKDWKRLFDFQIDGELVKIKSTDVDNFLDLLDDLFKEWETGDTRKKV